jgi:putative heme-binding domain-containing protein
LVTAIHRGALSDAERKIAIASGIATGNSSVRGLYEAFVPESQRRVTLGPAVEPTKVLNINGDAQRGRLIFFSDNARCKACHDLDDRSRSLGPSLKDIRAKFKTAAEMLPHVLQPSLRVDDPYAAYTVQTIDGRILSGLLAEDTPAAIVLKDSEKKQTRVERNTIEAMRRNEKSIMPEAIMSDLTAQEAADLISFIMSLPPS